MVVRTYAPIGKTPILKENLTRDHLSAMSGIVSESLVPAGARKAIGTEPLAWSGNLSPSRLLAAWLSVPGSERLSFVSWPHPRSRVRPSARLQGPARGDGRKSNPDGRAAASTRSPYNLWSIRLATHLFLDRVSQWQHTRPRWGAASLNWASLAY